MIVSNLPRLQSHWLPIVTSPLTQFFISKTPKKQFFINSTLLSKPLSTTLFTKTPEKNSSTLQESRNQEKFVETPQIELSLEKLFLPPDTDVSSLTTPLSSRVLKGSNIVLSKYASDAQVDCAEFIKSSVKTEECPTDGLPEFALVGRSNVGKSSLLNSLVRRKRLALTSKKPGKTQCINHFKINNNWYLVDLPGYGYAAAPQELRTDWDKFTKDYFLNRPNLVSVFLLIDASIPAKTIDLEYASWLGWNQIPMTLVFTKCDKRKKKKNGGRRPEENIQNFQELIREFFQTAPPWILTSSITNQGRDEILLHMSQLRNYWLKH
ncbi:GTP-binding protein At2g22870-like [Coffea eugenioides]|uniref:GTP-binding protein At2g22870-like n=1 Tax=Coffea eugenioides TaxID=49369 RepID=UPI000F6104E9|nr:GTP-binding protein At2g22870-like [Coffea eugenioides]XP_027149861.1 GTP-binding protein At2g22870-like [Coffea eugenioides]XP_027183294.1 GTP-binding protein At2g22870-like [Coffea eugenioides]XP_027183295.1 GTP-binding protein At2g22870-like [Coffea eugenioides]